MEPPRRIPESLLNKSVREIAEELVAAGAGSFDEIMDRLCHAIGSAAAETFFNCPVEASRDVDQIALYAVLTVVDRPARSVDQLGLDVARASLDPNAAPGDEMLLQIFYLGTDQQVDEFNAAQPIHLSFLAEQLPRWRARYPDVIRAACRAILQPDP